MHALSSWNILNSRGCNLCKHVCPLSGGAVFWQCPGLFKLCAVLCWAVLRSTQRLRSAGLPRLSAGVVFHRCGVHRLHSVPGRNILKHFQFEFR
jgi:hypothetical protein